MALEIPYLSFSGGEPMLHPHFFAMVEYVCARGSQLKVETNGHYLTPENCARLRDLGVKAVQVSLDGASRPTFNRIRVLGEFDRVRRGHPSPARRRRADRDQLLAHAVQHPRGRRRRRPRLRARRLQLLHRAHDVTATRSRPGATSKCPTSSTKTFFDTLRAKAAEYRGRMRVYFHEAGLLEELRYRLREPAALVIVLPNGLVKLINALPFVCGDLRTRFARLGLGELPARVARPARRGFRRRPRARSRADAHAAPMGPSLTTPDVAPATAPTPLRRLLRVVSMVRYRFFLYAGLLPYLLGAAWAWGDGRHVRRRRCSGRALRASCCPSSASRRSTNISTRAWAPIASSIPPTCRRSPTASSGAAWWRSPPRSPSACISRCTSAGRSSSSRCSAAWRPSSTRRRRSAGPTAGWASS